MDYVKVAAPPTRAWRPIYRKVHGCFTECSTKYNFVLLGVIDNYLYFGELTRSNSSPLY